MVDKVKEKEIEVRGVGMVKKVVENINIAEKTKNK